MSEEEKGYCTKEFDFVKTNNLDKFDFSSFGKKEQRKLLSDAFGKTFKLRLDKVHGTGKNPDKKAKKLEAKKDGNLFGKGGFLSTVLKDPREYDFYSGNGTMAAAMNGEAAIVVCEWLGSE